jgi:hypothetical protein
MSENWEGIACPLPGPGPSSVNLERGDGPGELAISLGIVIWGGVVC